MQIRQISIPLQNETIFKEKFSEAISFLDYHMKNIGRTIYIFLMKFRNLIRSRSNNFSERNNFSEGGRLKPKLNIKKLAKGALLILSVSFIAFILIRTISNFSTISQGNQEEQVEIKEVKTSQGINREFTFPLTDEDGEEVGKIKYYLESAELRDEIIVNGQKATSIKGRTFLIVILKISNDYSKSIEINTRDYIRLSVNGNKDEWLAPDIHNDPVEVQAISIKNTRVGFPIYESDKNLVLRIGEINGDKEEVELTL